ncbi:BRO-N domain-containing protein [Budvicia aquatica]|uniref:Uncharacterized phage-encoded protein n=2 Tax=Budvicia aquatica TaxID=82979 RepID=A0A2C6DLJ4_9GAMM|nr:BRO family protein [Budvicia aquatica]PHI31068.1 hypothetical protein CRN84_17880 [Budvicia aquatica]PHI31198.1 hypothetical protein CRN84_18565 [Budvicia aquatica]VFS51461.1 Uncharacterized phage-encoded protein [Budvicia aquatica]
MKNQLMTFKSHELGISLNGMLYQGKPVFFAVELAKALGYTNPSKALNDHCKSLITLNYNDSLEMGLGNLPRGIQLAPESDVYRLILKSQLPSAERVQDWVCEEVLPSIRETGSYGHQSKPMSEMEMIAAMALSNVEQERRLNHVEGEIETVAEAVENIKKGNMRSGYVGYRQVVAKSGMTDTKCRNLVNAYRIPTDTHEFMTPDGLLSRRAIVEFDPFMNAFHRMMSEAEPRGTRWYHPKMGLFQAIGWEK